MVLKVFEFQFFTAVMTAVWKRY